MQTGYFSTAWQDIKNSPGWFGKLILLSLVAVIPIFGWIVVYGYLYGWARDIAWGAHAPLPARVFGNEDGRLYSRGFFALVIAVVCAIIPGFVSSLGDIVFETGFGFGMFHDGWMPFGMASGLLGLLLSLVSVALAVFLSFFEWVGTMRMSIYGRLSAGFQIGRIWAMIRHDFTGLLRILGMAVVLFLGMWLVTSILAVLVVFGGVFVGGFVVGGGLVVDAARSDAVGMGVAMGVMAIMVLCSIALCLVAMAMTVFISMMVVRAVGYWTRQFNVPAWRGQEDPMPFELAQVYNAGAPRPPSA